jgi:hypothetical protein
VAAGALEGVRDGEGVPPVLEHDRPDRSDRRREALVARVRAAEDVGLGAGLEAAHVGPGVVLEVPQQAGLETVDLLAVDLRRVVVRRRAEAVALRE